MLNSNLYTNTKHVTNELCSVSHSDAVERWQSFNLQTHAHKITDKTDDKPETIRICLPS